VITSAGGITLEARAEGQERLAASAVELADGGVLPLPCC